MNGIAAALLVVAVVIQAICAAGTLVARDPLDRLHLVGPVSVLATFAVVIAGAIDSSSVQHTAKIVVTGAFLWVTSPFVSRATARALRIRDTGRLAVSGDELEADAP